MLVVIYHRHLGDGAADLFTYLLLHGLPLHLSPLPREHSPKRNIISQGFRCRKQLFIASLPLDFLLSAVDSRYGKSYYPDMKYLKIISPVTAQAGSYGVLRDDTVHLLDRSPLVAGAEETGAACRLAEVRRYLPPVEPPNIIALGLNYAQHAAESGSELPKAPVIFLKATTALTGHLQSIILPSEAPSEVDYEAELAVVIGKTARHIPESKVSDYIFGYTCMNDVSARDCQRRLDKQWARAKSFDTFAPMGPVVETNLDPSDLKVRTLLNGRTMQEGTTSDLIFNIPQIVSYLSRQFTLLPGTVISTGTPSGVGFARKPPVFLKAGDRVEIDIEGIGILENPVVEEQTPQQPTP